MGLKLPQGTGTRVFTGARAVFSFNGNIYGWAADVSGSAEVRYEAVDALGDLLVKEHAPVGYVVSMRARIFRTIAVGAATDAKANPGSLKEMGMFPHVSEILRLRGVDATIMDVISGKILYKLRETKAARNDFDITARGLVLQNVDFVAKVDDDESDLAA